MKKSIALLSLLFLGYSQDLFDANDLEKLYRETATTPQQLLQKYQKHKKVLEKKKVNDLMIMNNFYEKIEKSKYVEDFVFKLPREIDLLVSPIVKVIDNKYYVKTNPLWVKVMVYKKPEFR